MFLCVGLDTNESTMSRFSTRINSLHIWAIFSKLMVVEFEEALTSFWVEKPIYLARVSSLTTGPPLQIKKSWMDSTTVCDTSKTRRSRLAWALLRHAQSD